MIGKLPHKALKQMGTDQAMKRDPISLLFTALAVASLSMAAFKGRLEASAALNANSARSRDPTGSSDSSSGHDAGAPSEIPARGWWAIARRVAGSISKVAGPKIHTGGPGPAC